MAEARLWVRGPGAAGSDSRACFGGHSADEDVRQLRYGHFDMVPRLNP